MQVERVETVSIGVTVCAERRQILQGKRVLVVDDDSAGRHLMKLFLQQFGAIVVVAQSVKEARPLFIKEPPDLLIGDIRFHRSSGYELMTWVRSLSPEQGGLVPAIALSADVTPTARQDSLDAGFQLFCAKPFVFSELVTKIYYLLSLDSKKRTPLSPQ
ncbi:MAG: response regulator [Elainellaceae cyanobacterium]